MPWQIGPLHRGNPDSILFYDGRSIGHFHIIGNGLECVRFVSVCVLKTQLFFNDEDMPELLQKPVQNDQ